MKRPRVPPAGGRSRSKKVGLLARQGARVAPELSPQDSRVYPGTQRTLRPKSITLNLEGIGQARNNEVSSCLLQPGDSRCCLPPKNGLPDPTWILSKILLEGSSCIDSPPGSLLFGRGQRENLLDNETKPLRSNTPSGHLRERLRDCTRTHLGQRGAAQRLCVKSRVQEGSGIIAPPDCLAMGINNMG